MLYRGRHIQENRHRRESNESKSPIHQFLVQRETIYGQPRSDCPANSPRANVKGRSEMMILSCESPLHINLPRCRDHNESPRETKVLQSEQFKLPQITSRKTRANVPSMTVTQSKPMIVRRRANSTVRRRLVRVNLKGTTHSQKGYVAT